MLRLIDNSIKNIERHENGIMLVPENLDRLAHRLLLSRAAYLVAHMMRPQLTSTDW